MATGSRSVSFSLLFLAAANILFAGAAHGGAHGSSLCNKASNGAICRAVVKGAANPLEATKSAVSQLIFETKRAAAKLGKSETLDVCKENYDDAVSSLETSLKSLKRGDKPTVNINLSAAMTAFVTCDDALAESGAVAGKSRVLKTDAMLRKLASNSLYLSSLKG